MTNLTILQALAGGACLTTAELIQRLDCDPRDVTRTTSRLVSAGEIVRRERGCFQISEQGREILEGRRVVRTGPKGPLTQGTPRRPHRQTARDRLWAAMRIARKFTLADLQIQTGASRANTGRYVWALEGAGILVRARREGAQHLTSNGACRWLLLQEGDTGPRAPQVREQRGEVFDPNTGTTRTIQASGPKGRRKP